MSYTIEERFLLNESDVEQKIIWPLLTNPEPTGLGFNETHIQTKLSLRKIKIEKRKNSKLFYPDYVILIEGLPLIVIEVKKPNEDLQEAYREARLYALEINALYKESINPCKLIIASDGTKLLAGFWDSADPEFEIPISEWISTNEIFSLFIDNFCFKKIISQSQSIRNILRTNVTYRKPIHLLGGKHIQNRQIKNTFGESISIQYRYLFNPTNEFERTDIVTNAYVKIPKHLSHVNPIDRLIRNKIRPSILDSTEIADNISPKEIINKLQNAANYNNQVLLLVGSVGSGKTTFTTYLKEIALDRNLSTQLEWLRVDLNQAPVNSKEIYYWLKNSLCNELKNTVSNFDSEKMDSIKEIFSAEIEAFDKVALELFTPNSDKYKEKLFDKIQELQSDLNIKLNAYINYFIHKRGKELIIVLDNCDKRNLEEQLLMFEVANWLKENTKSIVFLPLRETTFDHFKNQKPLDTVVKDLIFRINPPSLEKVIYNRVKYASRISEKKENSYYLNNGIKISYPSEDELSYFKSILKSLFQNKFFKKLIVGIAGRDIRKGIEIFMDFCKSGHISDGNILQMKQAKGDFSLPNHIISRVFIRGNRLYYSDSDTLIKNLFFSDPSDKLPDPFIRIAILNWLKNKNRTRGESGIIGFHKISKLIKELTVLGHSLDRLNNELKTLIRNGLIISESQDINILEYNELISINSTGIIHLELLDNIDYLSSCSEDIWYNQESTANKIAERISGNSNYSHFSLQTTLYNSSDLLNYLKLYSDNYYSIQKELLKEANYNPPLDFDKLKGNVDKFKSSIGLSDFKEIECGTVVNSKIINILDYGIFCELIESSQIGLINTRQIEVLDLDIGDEIEVIVGKFRSKHNKYDLKIKP
jgi:GTPase SAR1 family protein